jgi:acetate kinase
MPAESSSHPPAGQRLVYRDVAAPPLEHRSGLLGLTGTADMREVIARARARERERDARLGLEVYVHHLRAGITSMAAAMDGLDALVFTGGVGEHSPEVRELAASGLGLLGVGLGEQQTPEATRNGRSARRTVPSACSWSPPARTLRSPRRPGACSGTREAKRSLAAQRTTRTGRCPR